MSRRDLPYGAESYAHREAKRILVGWLREAAAEAGFDGNAHLGGVGWRVNRPGPSWGVWEEYPFVHGGLGADPVWDEVHQRWRNRSPTHDEVVDLGFRPIVIADIAVQHKGRITFVIEIKHKNPVTPPKIGHLRRLDVGLIEIPTGWVLGQMADTRPESVPSEFWVI